MKFYLRTSSETIFLFPALCIRVIDPIWVEVAWLSVGFGVNFGETS